jgi:hypothetical protein
VSAQSSIPVYQLRGYPVALDSDIAERFCTKTGPFNQTIRRNIDRFSEDFAFQLTTGEWDDLKSQNVISSGHGGRRTVPWAFTEHGVVMAATLLHTEAAIAASRVIVRTFVAARRAEALLPEGTNLPLQIDLAETRPPAEARGAAHALARRAAGMIDRILDTIANDDEGTTVREEGRAILTKSLGAIRAHLDAKGIANEKTVAEIRKTLTEIEAIDTDIIARQIEADHRRLAYLAKQMQMVIAAQTYLETGEATGFLETLRTLSGE